MEDELWYCRDQSRRLQQARDQIAPLWNDTAAREISLRYLNPHAEEDTRMLDSFHSQLTALGEMDVATARAVSQINSIEDRSQAIFELLAVVEQEMAVSHQYVEYQARSLAQAEALFEQVQRLIAEAIAMCQGVPTS